MNRGHNYNGVRHAQVSIFAMLVPNSKLGPSFILREHNSLHITIIKGKIPLYNTTITPYRYNLHIILFRPDFVSSFTLAGPFWGDSGPFGPFWCFPQTDHFDAPLFFARYAYFPRKSVVGVFYCICTYASVPAQITGQNNTRNWLDFLYKLKILSRN